MKKIEAVECAACGALHKVVSDTYLIIEGKVLRGAEKGEKTLLLEGPKVICASVGCLCKSLSLGGADDILAPSAQDILVLGQVKDSFLMTPEGSEGGDFPGLPGVTKLNFDEEGK